MDVNVLNEIVNVGRYFTFMVDSDSEEDIPNEKIWGFAEQTVPRFKDHQFRQHFRMSPTTFENLLKRIHDSDNDYIIHSGHPELTVEKQVMATVWYLANIESFR